MTLGRKTLLILLTASSISLVASYAILQFTIDGTFVSLQQSLAASNMSRVKANLQAQLDSLKALNADYSQWDETYDFLTTGDPEYVEQNISQSILKNYEIDNMMILDLQHQYIAGFGGEPGGVGAYQMNYAFPEYPDIVAARIDKLESGGLFEVVRTRSGPAFVASLPILRNDASGPAVGYLVFVRYLTDIRVERIGLQIGVRFRFLSPGADRLPEEYQKDINRIDAEPVALIEQPINDTILSYGSIRNADDVLVTILEVETKNEISVAGRNALNLALAILLVTSLLYLLVSGTFLRHFIIKPLKTLTKGISLMRQSGKLLHIDTPERTDELGLLTNQFNALVLELDHRREFEEKRNQDQHRLEQQLYQAQKMEAVGQLTGGVAHDFNNILGTILGYTELSLNLDEADREEFLADYLDEIMRSVDRARDLVAQMLAYTSTKPTEIEPLQLEPLVKSALKLLRPLIPTSIEIRSKLSVGTSNVNVNSTQVEQVIMNLCINARDAMDEKGILEIELFQDQSVDGYCASCQASILGNYVALSVRDSGAGIDDALMAAMFDPFYTTKEVGKGSGMGLAMTHGIMHTFGGHIQVQSVAGQGATFRLLFPVTGGLVPEAREPVRLGRAPSVEVNRKGKVMVLDDEPSITRYLSKMLQNHGFDVTVSNDPQDAFEKITESSIEIDLLITDYSMPSMTGMELAEKVLSIRPEMPIILMTGYSAHIDGELAMKGGVKGFLKKPMTQEVMLEKVNQLL